MDVFESYVERKIFDNNLVYVCVFACVLFLKLSSNEIFIKKKTKIMIPRLTSLMISPLHRGRYP